MYNINFILMLYWVLVTNSCCHFIPSTKSCDFYINYIILYLFFYALPLSLMHALSTNYFLQIIKIIHKLKSNVLDTLLFIYFFLKENKFRQINSLCPCQFLKYLSTSIPRYNWNDNIVIDVETRHRYPHNLFRHCKSWCWNAQVSKRSC